MKQYSFVYFLILCLSLIPIPEIRAEWQQPQVQNPPSARYGHSLWTFGGNVYLFGGMVEQAKAKSQIPENDLWAFNREDLMWIQLTTPP